MKITHKPHQKKELPVHWFITKKETLQKAGRFVVLKPHSLNEKVDPSMLILVLQLQEYSLM